MPTRDEIAGVLLRRLPVLPTSTINGIVQELVELIDSDTVPVANPQQFANLRNGLSHRKTERDNTPAQCLVDIIAMMSKMHAKAIVLTAGEMKTCVSCLEEMVSSGLHICGSTHVSIANGHDRRFADYAGYPLLKHILAQHC